MSKALFHFILIILSTFLLLPLTSCVSKKKFRAEVANRTACDSTLQVINKRNLTLNRELADLNLQLAEKTGEVKALNGIHDKQVKEINHLESEIRKLTNQSLSQQQNLDGELQRKEKELADKQAVIQSFKDAIQTNETQLNEMISKVGNYLSNYKAEDLELEVKNGRGYIRLSEGLVFRKGTTKMTNNAYEIMEAIARVLVENPQMDIAVLGHTDNQPVRNSDSWDVSVLRATPIVQMLTKEFGINPNQIIAGGKGDSKPLSSNDTSQGRERNRRTEIVIYPPTDKLLKKIQDYQN